MKIPESVYAIIAVCGIVGASWLGTSCNENRYKSRMIDIHIPDGVVTNVDTALLGAYNRANIDSHEGVFYFSSHLGLEVGDSVKDFKARKLSDNNYRAMK